MAEPRKPRQAARASAAGKAQSKTAVAGKAESKAAAEFRRFKEARAATPATEGDDAAPSVPAAGSPPPMMALPPWAMPPSFSLPQPPQGWGGMLPQPGTVQPAPLAVGPLGDRLGSTLRLGIDVINMALAGSLRLLGGMGYSGHEPGYGDHCGCGGHPFAEHHGGYSCCCVFEHDDCCTPSVGNCCD